MADQRDTPTRRALLGAMPLAGLVAVEASCSTLSSAKAPALADPLDVRSFGARGDGATDDGRALAAALSAATTRRLVVPAGVYRFATPLVIPVQTRVELQPGVTLDCRVRDASAGITIGNGGKLVGSNGGADGARIVAHADCRVTALVTNASHDATQEYAYLEGLYFSVQRGAKVDAVIDLVSLFVNSGVRDCVIDGNQTADTCLRITGGDKSGFGPVYVENVWATRARGHNIVITERSPTRGSATCWLTNITSEHQGSGHAGLLVQGRGGLFNVAVRNFHYEHGNDVEVATPAIIVDGVPGFRLDGADLLAAPIANKRGIVITKSGLNTSCELRNVHNVNGLDPVLDDEHGGARVGARSIGFYSTGLGTEKRITSFVHMQGGLATKVTTAPVSDRDFEGEVPDGTLAVDTRSHRLYVRSGGVWRSTPLS